jgi:uncharacterized membrane protein
MSTVSLRYRFMCHQMPNGTGSRSGLYVYVDGIVIYVSSLSVPLPLPLPLPSITSK